VRRIVRVAIAADLSIDPRSEMAGDAAQAFLERIGRGHWVEIDVVDRGETYRYRGRLESRPVANVHAEGRLMPAAAS
jgi:hypothetical protein